MSLTRVFLHALGVRDLTLFPKPTPPQTVAPNPASLCQARAPRQLRTASLPLQLFARVHGSRQVEQPNPSTSAATNHRVVHQGPVSPVNTPPWPASPKVSSVLQCSHQVEHPHPPASASSSPSGELPLHSNTSFALSTLLLRLLRPRPALQPTACPHPLPEGLLYFPFSAHWHYFPVLLWSWEARLQKSHFFSLPCGSSLGPTHSSPTRVR